MSPTSQIRALSRRHQHLPSILASSPDGEAHRDTLAAAECSNSCTTWAAARPRSLQRDKHFPSYTPDSDAATRKLDA